MNQPDNPAAKKGAFSPRQLLGTAAKLLVTVVVIFYVIHKLGWSQVVYTCKHIDLRFALLGLGATVVSIILGAWQWHLLLHRKDLRLTFRESFELYYIGMFFNNIGTVAGDGIKVAYIKRRHDLGKIGFAATFLDRFAGLLALSIFAAAGCGLLLARGAFSSPTVLIIVRVTGILFAFFFCMLLFLISRRLRRLFFVVAEKLRLPKREFINDLVATTGLDVNHFSLIVRIAVLSMIIQWLRISVHLCSAAAFGILTGQNFIYFFIFVPLIALFMVIPLPFGIRETLGGYLFSLTGIGSQPAFLMQFMATLIGVGGSLWGGIEFLINRAHHKSPRSGGERTGIAL